MTPRLKFALPARQEELQKRAVRLQWVSIVVQTIVVLLMFVFMGSSQAMKTAWAEDVLALVPPIAYVIAIPITRRQPNETFPYGYQRAVSIAFLCAALALFATGAYLLIDSVYKLAAQEHPTIPSMDLLGWHVWQGWPMVAVLAATGAPPVLLGLKKLTLARELHDKALHADADMNKANWLTPMAAMFGILGIAFGLWWADALAGAFISLEVTHDGVKNVKRVVLDLMDRAPTDVQHDEPLELRHRLVHALEELPWVQTAEARLREEGHVLCGEAFLVLRDEEDLVHRLEHAGRVARSIDWRLFDVVVTAVACLPAGAGARPERRPSSHRPGVRDAAVRHDGPRQAP